MDAAKSTFQGHGKTSRSVQESCFLPELLRIYHIALWIIEVVPCSKAFFKLFMLMFRENNLANVEWLGLEEKTMPSPWRSDYIDMQPSWACANLSLSVGPRSKISS